MSTVHPFLKRIRTERAIISLINEQCGYFGSELTGLSIEAVRGWFNGISEPVTASQDMKAIKNKLEYLGKLTKLESNGSHRGAMVAPVPNEEVTDQLIYDITRTLMKLPSNKENQLGLV